MALKAYYEKKEDVPAHVAEDYVERNGRFELSVDVGLSDAKSFTDFANLNSALNKERGDHKATKTRFTLLGDRKLEDVIALADRVPELEAQVEAGGGRATKEQVDKLVAAQIAGKLAPVERDLATARQDLAARDKTISEFTTKERTRKIHDAVREACTKKSVIAEAVEDVLLQGERVLEVTDDGKIVTKDGVGVTPGLMAEVWLTDMQKSRPHWWGTSGGGGAPGAKGGTGDLANNPWSREHWNLTEQGRVFRENRPKAEQLAKAAGTTIGGGMPPVKK